MKKQLMMVHDNCIDCVNGTKIQVMNNTGLEFKTVMPVILLSQDHGWTLCGVGNKMHWWKKDGVSMLVDKRTTNCVLHGYAINGVIVTFSDSKNEGKQINKFVPIDHIYMDGLKPLDK